MRQLQEKGFPNILWLRLPDPFELDDLLKTKLPPQRRVIALWRTTVLPAVWQVCETYNYTGAMVVEDTVLLREDVTYRDVASEIQQTNGSGGGGDQYCNATGAGSGTSHRQVEGGGGGGQPTVPANQGDQRGAGHSMMQGGGGGRNLSCQLLQAASRATPTQVTRPRQQACSQAVGDVATRK